VHLYKNQFEYAQEILGRDLGTPGTVTINKNLNRLEDLLAIQWNDIEVSGLVVNTTPLIAARPPMAV
jgi:thymidylate synthase